MLIVDSLLINKKINPNSDTKYGYRMFKMYKLSFLEDHKSNPYYNILAKFFTKNYKQPIDFIMNL